MNKSKVDRLIARKGKRTFAWLAQLCAAIEPDKHGCMIWPRATTPQGYGIAGVQGKIIVVHKFVLEWKLGHPLEDLALHTCGVKNCVNPDHLYEGTHGERHRSKDTWDYTRTRKAKRQIQTYWKEWRKREEASSHRRIRNNV